MLVKSLLIPHSISPPGCPSRNSAKVHSPIRRRSTSRHHWADGTEHWATVRVDRDDRKRLIGGRTRAVAGSRAQRTPGEEVEPLTTIEQQP